MKRYKYSFTALLFITASRFMGKVIRLPGRVHNFISPRFYGFWLGFLTREAVQQAGDFAYRRSSLYFGEGHNKGGLFDWEEKTLQKYFQGCKSLLVAGAGGGREVFALRKKGYYVDGFECNRHFVDRANEMLKGEGMIPDIAYVRADLCVENDKIYDGLIIGWGAYMHIQGAGARIAFLRGMRKHAKKGSPVLLSFWSQADTDTASLYAVISVANRIRKLLRRECVEFGDNLGYRGYVHFFTREEIAEELCMGGFDLANYSTAGNVHAVGVASGS